MDSPKTPHNSGTHASGGQPGTENPSVANQAADARRSAALVSPGTNGHRAPELTDEDFRVAFELAPVPMALISIAGQFLRVNRAMCSLTGYGVDELLDLNFRALSYAEDLPSELSMMGQLVAGEIDHYEIEKRNYNAYGQTSWLLKSAALVRHRGGAPSHLLVQYLDISERKMFEERMRYIAEHDTLTGLRSRRVFETDLAAQAARCKRYDEKAVLMMLDIDAFKAINDRFGHKTGDAVLIAVANGLLGRVRAGDLPARIGGDEFAVIMPHMDMAATNRIADHVRVAVENAVNQGSCVAVRVTVSVGVAAMSSAHCDTEAVMVEADEAMYAEKRTHKVPPKAEQGGTAR